MTIIYEILDFLNEYDKYIILGLLVVSALILGICIYLLVDYIENEIHSKKNIRRKNCREKKYSCSIEGSIKNDIQEEDFKEAIIECFDDPVIEIKDICMNFKVVTESSNGVKDWLINFIKGKNKYRILQALDHVSFNVYEGEVIGIIGTNGSGKSTLLKIVSGAILPTNGEVIVDRRKVQLLTLGTGFDMELTARENIYLNGAIIGYSRKFIDDHFDEIVEFAELQDFVDEKVKNFSSGMVSRLGFSIATVGDAAEILILDEVLSVGDEFFRKKSLARIKEMIHGGSTVLMVSHGMDTIKDNCSKVVWIEKGKLMMIGSANEVCDAYSKQKKE